MTQAILRTKEDLEAEIRRHQNIMSFYTRRFEQILLASPCRYAITFDNGVPVFKRIQSAEEIMLQATIDTLNQCFQQKAEWAFEI